ncbi:hypothetical protein Lal_00030208 [Lupinus albus]|nr:hypothetical protein Lal_00030208 [Lupinus albus]
MDLREADAIHENIASKLIPKIGMEFECEDATYTFYNYYAYKVGFSIRRGRSHKAIDGQVVDRLLFCSCEGHRVNDKRDVYVRKHRDQTRFGCLARMKISNRLTGKLSITEFIGEHNHQTSTPIEVDLAESCGITPKASCELMARQAGGRENLGFIPDDYMNYLHSKRTIQMRTGDTIDEDDLITNIFWADAKMMVDYSYFGDIVCFDTTYRKNREGRPFAMFVGVNHHKLSIIFGATLLYDETAETFVWLFNTFSKAMLGKNHKLSSPIKMQRWHKL